MPSSKWATSGIAQIVYRFNLPQYPASDTIMLRAGVAY